MDYFHEKLHLTDKVNEKLSEFLDRFNEISLQESQKELYKSRQFAKEINKNLNTTNISQETNARGIDYAAYYMCRDQLGLYKYAVLLAHAYNLQGEIDKHQKSKKKKHVNKFSE